MKNLSIIVVLLAVILASCSSKEAPIATTDLPPILVTDTTPAQELSTITPESTPDMLTAGIYKDDKIMFTYPPEWHAGISRSWIIIANNPDILDNPSSGSYDKGDAAIFIGIAPLERQANGNEIQTLDQYTLFMNMENPDKEIAHMVTLGNKEFAIGTYSESYINSRNGEIPLFIAVHFSKQSTITIEMYASPNEEAELRQVFENILASIEIIPIIKTTYPLHPFEPMLFISADEMSGWTEPTKNQIVYSGATCRWFEDSNVAGRTLTTCIIRKSQYTDLTTLREQYSSTSPNSFIDLESMTKHSFAHEFDVYAYQDVDESPVFHLILENYNLIHSVEIRAEPFQAGENFGDSAAEYFTSEIDDLLQIPMAKMLEKSKFPFDPELLIPANGLEGWKKPLDNLYSDFGSDEYQDVYSDGICRTYTHKINYSYFLYNCIFYVAEDYNLESIKESFQNDSKFIELETKYEYDHDFVLYGYLSGNHPTFTLYLEKDGILFNAEVAILESYGNVNEAISRLYDDELDKTLRDVITKNLERFK